MWIADGWKDYEVLDTSSGIEEFEFEEDVGKLAVEAGDPQERGVADQLGEGMVNHICQVFDGKGT